MARWVEIVGGALAAAVGVSVAVAMTALGAYGWAVALVVLGGLGAAVGAYAHAFRGNRQGVYLLWVSSLALVIMTILGVFSVGIFLLPGTLAALIASLTGTWWSKRSTPDA